MKDTTEYIFNCSLNGENKRNTDQTNRFVNKLFTDALE